MSLYAKNCRLFGKLLCILLCCVGGCGVEERMRKTINICVAQVNLFGPTFLDIQIVDTWALEKMDEIVV